VEIIKIGSRWVVVRTLLRDDILVIIADSQYCGGDTTNRSLTVPAANAHVFRGIDGNEPVWPDERLVVRKP
jgi:hypothetical protein